MVVSGNRVRPDTTGEGLGRRRWVTRVLRRDVVVAGGIFALAFGLYLRTLTPDMVSADAGEFQFVPAILGIAHPPGYPLYTLLGWAFSALPFGSIAYRANLMSAFFGASTIPLVYLAGLRVMDGVASGAPLAAGKPARRLAAFCAAGLLATSVTWWSQSTVAAVRTLNGFFVALCLLLAIRWAYGDGTRWLLWLAFAFGLSLTHHITMWSLAPAFLSFMLISGRRAVVKPSTLLALAWRFVAPLSIYLYLPLRSALGAPFNPIGPMTLSSFLDTVTARGFSDAFFYYRWEDMPRRLEVLSALLFRDFGPVGVALAALGAVGALLVARPVLLLLALVIAGNGIVTITYQNTQTAGYLIPSFIVVALFAGLGIWTLARMIGSLPSHRPAVGRFAATAVALLALLAPLQALALNFAGLDASGDREARDFAAAALQAAAPGSTILADWHDVTPLDYLQFAEGLRRDVHVEQVLPETDKFPWTAVADKLKVGEIVYLTQYHREIAPAYRLRPSGPLLQVLANPDYADPAPSAGSYTAVGANLGGKVLLLGYRLTPQEVLPGAKISLTIFWKALEKMSQAYTVMVKIPTSDGAVWALESGYPGMGHRPTVNWEPGEVVIDERELTVAPDAPPGQYPVMAGMYDLSAAGQGQPLPPAGRAGEDMVTLGTVDIAGQTETPLPAQFSADATFGGLARLVGYDIDHWSGTSLGLTLYWRVLQATTENLSVGLSLRDGSRTDVGQHSSWPEGGLDPTSRWQPGQLVIDRHEVKLAKEPAGKLDVQVKLLRDGGQELPTGNGRPVMLAVPESLNDPGDARINFNDQALLTHWQVGQPAVKPGENLDLYLDWQPFRRISDDCAVFVHLLGKDGQVWGQGDDVPVFGGLPTMAWVKGRTVHDHHVVPVKSETPPGEYHLAVGLYVMKTGARWPVVERELLAAGQADRVLLGPITVR